MIEDDRAAGKIKVGLRQRHHPRGRGMYGGAPGCGHINPVVRVAWLAIVEPLAAIDARNRTLGRPYETRQHTGDQLRAFDAGGAGVGDQGRFALDARQLLRWGRHRLLRHTFHPLYVVLAPRYLQGFTAGRRAGDHQVHRRRSIAAEAGKGGAIGQHIQGLATEAHGTAGRHLAPDKTALLQRAVE